LLHAAGKLVRIFRLETGQADHPNKLVGAGPGLARCAAAPGHEIAQQANVCGNLEPRHQVRLLEHESDAAGVAQIAGRRAADRDGAARRRHQIGDHLEQGGLAAAGWADQRHESAVGNIQVYPRQRLDGLGAADAVDDVDIRDPDRGAAIRDRPACKLGGTDARHVSSSPS